MYCLLDRCIRVVLGVDASLRHLSDIALATDIALVIGEITKIRESTSEAELLQTVVSPQWSSALQCPGIIETYQYDGCFLRNTRYYVVYFLRLRGGQETISMCDVKILFHCWHTEDFRLLVSPESRNIYACTLHTEKILNSTFAFPL